MADTSWTRRSGLAGAVGGGLYALGLTVLAIGSGSDWGFAQIVVMLGFIIATPLLAIELFGLRARMAGREGVLGLAGLAIGLTGMATALIGLVGLAVGEITSREINGAWDAMIFGLLGAIIGMAAIAGAGLLSGMLPRWSSLTVLAGGLIGVIGFATGALGLVSEEARSWIVLPAVISLIICFAGWAALGYSLWAGAAADTSAPAADAPGVHA